MKKNKKQEEEALEDLEEEEDEDEMVQEEEGGEEPQDNLSNKVDELIETQKRLAAGFSTLTQMINKHTRIIKELKPQIAKCQDDFKLLLQQ